MMQQPSISAKRIRAGGICALKEGGGLIEELRPGDGDGDGGEGEGRDVMAQ